MPTYKTPGVYIEEISTFPPSVAPVATAVPVFIGSTEKTLDDNLAAITVFPSTPRRITSLLEFEKFFGGAQVSSFDLKVEERGTEIKVVVEKRPALTEYHYLYYSMRMFYDNGGGICYIISLGSFTDNLTVKLFKDAILLLEPVDEPTLLVFPDACLLKDNEHGSVVDEALKHCHKMQDRFTIADVRNAVKDGTDTDTLVTNNFRANVKIGVEQFKYGAAYFPYVRTNLPFNTDDTKITIANHKIIAADGTATDAPQGVTLKSKTLDKIKTSNTAVYNAAQLVIGGESVTLPPSGGVAGVYARVDSSRGVWKAPANVGLLDVIEPMVKITDDLNNDLNVDVNTGKSVNAIRYFTGRGSLVWGARTLAGNDNEYRYIPVRRFLNFAEESIKKAIGTFVFEPNDANTWVKVRSMIESFLVRQWRDGALVGAKPEDAFRVKVGLNLTMTPQDVLDGMLIVEVKLAVVRPAEFIILRFSQMLQSS